MNYKEALKELNGTMLELTLECETEKSERRKQKISREFAALIRANEALEKQIPKKLAVSEELYHCPCCGEKDAVLQGDNYCFNCGQALDWQKDEKGEIR